MSLPSLDIRDLRPEQIRRVPITRHAVGWQLPDGTIFDAVFRPKHTLLRVPDWGFTTRARDDAQDDEGPITFTTTFARQAGTLIATAPVPDLDDEAAGAARLASDLHGAFGAPAAACRAELAAFVQTVVAHLLRSRPAGRDPSGILFPTQIPITAAKPGHILHPLLPPEGFPVPGKILVALVGTARTVRNGQARPLDGIWLRTPATAHDRLAATAAAQARLDRAEARTRLDLRGWIAALPPLAP
jgi:hypothetical protein